MYRDVYSGNLRLYGKEHSETLGDFRAASLEDLEDALGLAAWPALSKIRFLNAWRRLKDGEDASSEPQRPRSAAELAGSTRAREPSSGIA